MMKIIALLLALAVVPQWAAFAQVSGERTSKLYRSDSYFIPGAVQKPGVYQAKGRLSLLDLILMAGGLAEHHGATAYIIRERHARSKANLRDEVIPVDIAALLKSSAPR